ncbi:MULTISPECIES: ABC transporter ATP-binding protein [Bacillaceae]|uniref:ABC transport system ATP-binding protein n=1 Tax=Peribacillus huizhouensis TaxID=1501239 RepID=A0ABR6CU19_9BACI|nr:MULTISPECIES: phosphate ABC transporter ATP-binding protein [Bacillaceae]MBA9028095.1 putative ABC transport system ATP-binding protein [Peribacillus huizhouensis]
MTTEIEFINVSKTYLNQQEVVNVLKGVSGKVEKGEIVTIIGPSGSGKSTILSLCNLLLTPDEGEVWIQGKDVGDWDIQTLRRQVGIAFQGAPMLTGTVQENLSLPKRLQGKTLENPKKYMEYVGLTEDLLLRQAKELSGGQRQRLSLARTLVNDPAILLLDEVTSALDSLSAHEVEELILRINRERQTTILWVTHDQSQAERVGDQTWLVIEGRIVEAAPTKQFFVKPKQEQTKQFLEMRREYK